jgi:hypothetical protein
VQILLEVAALLERLDRAYLRGWAERLGLSDLLGRALGEAQVDRPR